MALNSIADSTALMTAPNRIKRRTYLYLQPIYSKPKQDDESI
ncbi:hypothetical protein CZ794_12040 [Psychrobacter sp. JB385]|nr:hypothetical protein CZ794_12040 [Psychrobacter sp. JB385]